jgi:FHA domain
MTSGGPPKGSDTRREPGFDDDELPTDIIRRDPSLTAKAVRLRLEQPRSAEDCESGEPTVTIRKNRVGSGSAVLPRDLRAWFDVKCGPAAALGRVDVTMARVVIGRGHQADLRIEDTVLSRQHAVVFFTGEEFRIRDEDSVNGTVLNGSHVVEYALRDGDEVGVGTSLLVFRTTRGG